MTAPLTITYKDEKTQALCTSPVFNIRDMMQMRRAGLQTAAPQTEIVTQFLVIDTAGTLQYINMSEAKYIEVPTSN